MSSRGVSPARGGIWFSVVDALERQALFVAGLSAAWLVLLLRIPLRLNQDGYLALVAGREVADRGIPQHDRLAALTLGARWIDQQWLSQYALYELERAGGLAAYCIVYAGLAVAALGMAIFAARSLGAADLHVLAVLIPPTVIYIGASAEVRTQGFAYPLFVAVLWLLLAEVRRPSRRGLWVFPLLILWANLHGSVVLGIGLTVLYGVSILVPRRGDPGPAGKWPWRRAAIYIVGAPLCLLATPYGFDGITYYRDTLGDHAFRTLIAEWGPVTSVMILAVPFFIVAFAATWLLGRAGRRHDIFEHLVLYALTASGITAIRNITWLGLAAIMILPGLVGTVWGAPAEQERKRTLNLTLAGGAIALLVGALVVVAAKPRSWFEQGYDRPALTVIADRMRADPSLKVDVGDRFGDWLLWNEPQLAGRISYDSRLELLTDHQLHKLSDYVSEKGGDATDIVRPFGLVILDPKRQKSFTKTRLKDPGTRVVYRGHDLILATRPTP